jgi:hypothetical protein
MVYINHNVTYRKRDKDMPNNILRELHTTPGAVEDVLRDIIEDYRQREYFRDIIIGALAVALVVVAAHRRE